MKNILEKIKQNKFQLIFSVSLAFVLLVSLVVARNINTQDEPIVDTPIINEPTPDPTPDTGDVTVQPEEVFKKPFSETIEYSIVRKFYEKESSALDQELSLIKYNNSYRTSNGTSFAQKDNQVFDVLSSLSGKVAEIKEKNTPPTIDKDIMEVGFFPSINYLGITFIHYIDNIFHQNVHLCF